MDPDIDDDDLLGQPEWRPLSILPCSAELELSDPHYANTLYEKAIRENAGSYKLWHAYLQHRVRILRGKPLDSDDYVEINNLFERALVFMHKMPRIWIEYCTLLDSQLLVTRTRRTFNRALEALPITQHSRIWPLYLKFAKNDHVPVETAVRIFNRHRQLRPEYDEEFIDYLYVKNRIDEAATLLCDVINRPNFQSKKNKTKYQLWEELCDMICEFADQIHGVNSEAILRDGIARYHDQQGRLWNSLARYNVQLGMFANARNIYDEAINTVTTKKDFVEVWEAYTNFEEKYLEHLLEIEDPTDDQKFEIELRHASLEELITNNGLLLNRVALRQNPHNVREWQKRITLCDQVEESEKMKEETYIEALRTVDPKQALGQYEELWIGYAMFHALSGRISRSRDIFNKAVEAKFTKYDELAKVWCAYIELEIKLGSDKALKLARQATATIKNLRLWSLYADLEENQGNFNSTKAVYERILDLKIATPQLVLNYAKFLETHKYYEESFRAYERGTSLFKWPNSVTIWHTYISKFLSRYGHHKKLDRVRDLLEQSLKDCPADFAFNIYILYAKIEEESGLTSRAMSIYTRASQHVEGVRKADLFRIYISSMMKLVDLQRLRSIYEQAIKALDNENARKFCLEYASLEEELGEIDRARTIYSFCSQFCDPKSDKEFWRLWTDFEQKHGELESIGEMLRIKRSLDAQFARS